MAEELVDPEFDQLWPGHTIGHPGDRTLKSLADKFLALADVVNAGLLDRKRPFRFRRQNRAALSLFL